MSQPITPPPSLGFDQVFKGNVDIKKISKNKYKITFSKISKFLIYQIWSKNTLNDNENRKVYYQNANLWIQNFNSFNASLKGSDKPLFTPTTVMEIGKKKYIFVINEAKINYKNRVVFKVSNEEIKLLSGTSKKIPQGSFHNVRFDMDDLICVCYDFNGTCITENGPGFACNECFVAGTEITLADGSKKAIENITYEDELRVWDFDRGVQTSAKPLWIKLPQTSSIYNHARFADGTELKTLSTERGHRVFCSDTNQFEPVGLLKYGATIVKASNTTTLISSEQVRPPAPVVYYNIITDYHMNMYANDVLTSTVFNNLYPIKDMKFEKIARIPRTYTGIPEYFIKGLRLAENIPHNLSNMTRFLQHFDSLRA